MTKAEKTRQYIIEQTAPLFNCKGFAGTSLTDLTETTGLTKGALYGNFESKEEIAMEAFKFAMKKVRALAREQIDFSKNYTAQLMALLQFYSNYVFDPPVPGGCPLLNTAVEADDSHNNPMRRVVVKEVMQTVGFIQELLDKGVKAGEFKKSINTSAIAYVFFCSIEGAIIFSRIEKSREPMNIIVDHCKNILKQISKSK